MSRRFSAEARRPGARRGHVRSPAAEVAAEHRREHEQARDALRETGDADLNGLGGGHRDIRAEQQAHRVERRRAGTPRRHVISGDHRETGGATDGDLADPDHAVGGCR